MKRSIALLSVITLFAGCGSTPKSHPPTNRVAAPPAGAPVLFVADPQIHNVFGMKLQQMTYWADTVSKVAVRPPELNILAPLILEHSVSRAAGETDPSLAIVLGDATNIACSGEYESFAASIEASRPAGVPLLMAHGNHDSYLMGTVNSYIPENVCDWEPEGMAQSPRPTDQSWWGSGSINAGNERNWRDACFQPPDTVTEPSSPMNKSRWLSKYIRFLEKDGLIDEAPIEDAEGGELGIPLHYTAEPGSLLDKYNYAASGLWVQPKFGPKPSSDDTDFMRVSRSYIVQRVDVDGARIVVIDTSVCEKAWGGFKFKWTNAGEHACIGDNQFARIETFIEDTPEHMRLVIAGHFPLADLTSRDRKRLIELASGHENWVYMSAHSHNAVSETRWKGGWEINVGSTTDWPMEVNAAWFNTGKRPPAVQTFTNRVPEGFSYESDIILGKAEVCRHLPAAKFLADVRESEMDSTYAPPLDKSCSAGKQEDWLDYGNDLAGYMDRIRMRFKANEKYRQYVLQVAGAASRKQSRANDLAGLIP